MKYIDKEKLITEIKAERAICTGEIIWPFNTCIAIAERLPEIEQNRGAWVFRPVKDWGAVNCNCSECGKGYFLVESDIYKYCPNCGAVMEC